MVDIEVDQSNLTNERNSDSVISIRRKLQFENDAEEKKCRETCIHVDTAVKHTEQEETVTESIQLSISKSRDLQNGESTTLESSTVNSEEPLEENMKVHEQNENVAAEEIVVKSEKNNELVAGQSAVIKEKSPYELQNNEIPIVTEVNNTETAQLTYTTLTTVPSQTFEAESESHFLSPRLPYVQHPVISPMNPPNVVRQVGVKYRPIGVHQTRVSRGGNSSTPYPRALISNSYPPNHLPIHQPGWQGNIGNSFHSLPSCRIPSGAMVSDQSDTSTDSSGFVTPFSSSSSSFVSTEDTSNSSPDFKNDDGPMFNGQSFMTPDGQHVTQYKDAFGNIRYFYPVINERENHNVKERKRRSRVAESCSILRSLIPGLSDKTDKATVFEYAARYLTFLREKFGMQFDQAYIEKYYQ